MHCRDTDMAALSCGGAGTGRQDRRSAKAGEREHTHGDTSRDAVEKGARGERSHRTVTHLVRHCTQKLHATGGPRHPGRHNEHAHRVPGEWPPVRSETAGQRIADDECEYCRHDGEREHGGEGRAEHVAGTAASTDALFTHRPGRS